MVDVIPEPRHVAAHQDGSFAPGPATRLSAGDGTQGTERWLRATLGAATGLPLPPGEAGDDDVIRLSLDPAVTAELGEEGYRLDVLPNGVRLAGGGPAGLFWGAQTLRQLLGPDAFRRAPLPGRRPRLPLTRIQDAPGSAGAASCSTWPGTSCPRTTCCANSISWPRTNSTSSTSI